MQHRMLFPLRFQFFNGKPFEEFFLSFKVGFKGREKKTFTKTAWTTQERLYDILSRQLTLWEIQYGKGIDENTLSLSHTIAELAACERSAFNSFAPVG